MDEIVGGLSVGELVCGLSVIVQACRLPVDVSELNRDKHGKLTQHLGSRRAGPVSGRHGGIV